MVEWWNETVERWNRWLYSTSRNDEAVRLVKELAELEGESMTKVVIEAVREKLVREQARQSNAGFAEKLMAIGRGTVPLWAGPALSVLHGDLLYDEYGLPM